MVPFFVMYRTVVFELDKVRQRHCNDVQEVYVYLESSTLKGVLSLSVPFERSNSAFF
jgi:hypothetical protein